ncbi:MAG: hypothetical protein ABI120_00450, partial [Gemmatimonadaceae bacterium]
MNAPAKQSRSDRTYSTLLRLLPKEFRREYEQDMREFFMEKLRDVRERSGTFGVARLWGRTLVDIVVTACIEHVATLRAGATPASIARA